VRKFFVSSIVSLVLLVAIPMTANASVGSLVAGMLLGSSMSSNDDESVQAEGNANVLYLMPRVIERVTDPLGMRLTSVRTLDASFRSGHSVREIFHGLSFPKGKTAENYEVLQVVRVMDRGDADNPCLWFTYIEKDKIISLNELPAPGQK
jgi:hypothetical protein